MYWIYSHEALPNPEMMGKPRYTPDGSYIRYGGVTLPVIPKQAWMELPEALNTLRRTDWRDRQGNQVEVPIRRFKPIVDNQFAERGVVMLDHEPSKEEKAKLEHLCAQENMKFRKRSVEFFENQRDMAKARGGTYDPTPYIDECYDILGMNKPYSVEALEALRDPGKKAAERFADAIVDALKKDREDTAIRVAEELTRPSPKPEPARR